MEAQDRIRLEPSWKHLLLEEFTKDYMQELRAFLAAQKQAGKTIYPPGDLIFNAFNLTDRKSVV